MREDICIPPPTSQEASWSGVFVHPRALLPDVPEDAAALNKADEAFKPMNSLIVLPTEKNAWNVSGVDAYEIVRGEVGAKLEIFVVVNTVAKTLLALG